MACMFHYIYCQCKSCFEKVWPKVIAKDQPPLVGTKSLFFSKIWNGNSHYSNVMFCQWNPTIVKFPWDISPSLSHDSCLSEHRQCCNAYRCSSLGLSATQAGTKSKIDQLLLYLFFEVVAWPLLWLFSFCLVYCCSLLWSKVAKSAIILLLFCCWGCWGCLSHKLKRARMLTVCLSNVPSCHCWYSSNWNSWGWFGPLLWIFFNANGGILFR